MNLNEFSQVSPSKVEALKKRIVALKIDLRDITESFVRGGGKGGQKINKTSNAVVLKYPAFDLVIKVQRERQRNINRFLALRELVDRIEMKVSPETSARLKQFTRLRKQKDRRLRRNRQQNQN